MDLWDLIRLGGIIVVSVMLFSLFLMVVFALFGGAVVLISTVISTLIKPFKK